MACDMGWVQVLRLTGDKPIEALLNEERTKVGRRRNRRRWALLKNFDREANDLEHDL